VRIVTEDGTGNLLTADVDALVNTVNTAGVMGKGIALQFKRAFPDNYRVYRAACNRGEVCLGEMFVYDTGRLGPRRYVINFPTKGHWRSRSRIEDIRSGLADLLRVALDLELTSIAVPALGCGNGGLSWSTVRPLIEETFQAAPDVRVVVFPPTGAPDPATMPVATKRPSLTGNRAALLVTLERYLHRARALEVRDGVSELEIQKLVYFLQVLGQPFQLTFARGRYGPYAEQIHHVLQSLEGHYLVGYGDRSARVADFEPIRLTEGTAEKAAEHLEPAAAERIDRLMALAEGFQTPYSLELLATAHFAASYEPVATEFEEISTRVASWNLRKARMFTPRHVAIAVEQLSEHALLTS